MLYNVASSLRAGRKSSRIAIAATRNSSNSTNGRTSNARAATSSTPPMRAVRHGKSKGAQATSSITVDLVRHVYEPCPQPFNCTTLLATRSLATDPSHPFYIKIQRRVAAHDPKAFVWVVRCSTDVSKKPTYRHLVQKSLRRAFREALRRRGYDHEGKRLPEEGLASSKREAGTEGEETRVEKSGRISGALAMFYVNDQKRVMNAKGAEIRAEAERILERVLKANRTAQSAPQQRITPHATRPARTDSQKRFTTQQWQLGKMRERSSSPREDQLRSRSFNATKSRHEGRGPK